MSEIASEGMDLNNDESQQEGILHKFTEQNNYEGNRNEEDDEHVFHSKEK